MKTVYHMKYALTGGAEVIQIDQKQSKKLKDEGYFTLPGFHNLFRNQDIAYTEEEAEKMFEELRIKKLQSLDKQVKKYSKMKFKIKEDRS